MAIGTHTGEQFESLFDLQIARQDAKQPVTGSDSEVKMAKDIELPPTIPYDTKTDSDTPGVATNPKSYYDERIQIQPYRGDPTEGTTQFPNAGKPLGNRTTPMLNKSGKPQISLNEYEEASPFKVAMADMAPEGMRIPVSRIQQTRRQELAGGGGGGGVQSIEQKGVEAYKKALEPPKEYAIRLTDKDKQGNSYNYQFRDKDDKIVGGVSFQVQNGGKDIHIDYIDAWKVGGSNSLGPKNTRDLLRQFKVEFPDAERLYGYRVSGARQAADNTSEAWIPLKPGVRVMDKVKESQHNESLRREQDRALRDELSSLSTQEVGRRRQIIEDALDRNPGMTREEIRGLFNRPATDPLDQVRNQNLDRLRQLGGTNRDPYEQVPYVPREQLYRESGGFD